MSSRPWSVVQSDSCDKLQSCTNTDLNQRMQLNLVRYLQNLDPIRIQGDVVQLFRSQDPGKAQWYFGTRDALVFTLLAQGTYGRILHAPGQSSVLKVPYISDETIKLGSPSWVRQLQEECYGLMAEYLIQTEIQAQWAHYRDLATSAPRYLVAPVRGCFCFHWHELHVNVPVVEFKKIDGTLCDLIFQPSASNIEACLFDAVDQIARLRLHCDRAGIKFNHRDSHPQNIYYNSEKTGPQQNNLQWMFGDLGMSCVVSGEVTAEYQDVYAYTRHKVRSCDNSVHDLRILLFSVLEYFCKYPRLGVTFPKFKAWIEFYFKNNFFNTRFGQQFWSKNGATFHDKQTWFFHQAYDDLIDQDGDDWKCFLPHHIIEGLALAKSA